MKKHNRKRRNRFKTKTRAINLEPEELVVYARLAEKEVLPIIKDMEFSAGAAIFLLAQYTQVLITGSSRSTEENATNISNNIIMLWQAGVYQPSPQYPFTLEETLLDLKNDVKAQADYSEDFQPFTPTHPLPPRGVGQVAGGIVLHPKTRLWQIWMMLDGPCVFLGAYRDPSTAQKMLEEIINMKRQGKGPEFAQTLYQKVVSRGDGEPQQISFDMMLYLIDHTHVYMIDL